MPESDDEGVAQAERIHGAFVARQAFDQGHHQADYDKRCADDRERAQGALHRVLEENPGDADGHGAQHQIENHASLRSAPSLRIGQRGHHAEEVAQEEEDHSQQSAQLDDSGESSPAVRPA